MAAQPAIEMIPEVKGPCLDTGDLLEVFSRGCFATTSDALLVLDHLAHPCRRCWNRLEALALDKTIDADLDVLTGHALRGVGEPPIALVLIRLVGVFGGTGAEAALAPVHRHLLRRAPLERFDFWWLLVEETRLLALSSSEGGVERWRAFAELLAGRSWGPRDFPPSIPRGEQARELRHLVRAYEADELHVGGDPEAAEKCLAKALAAVQEHRPEIRALISEVRADHDRSLCKPHSALTWLKAAERDVRAVDIPGRLGEVRARIAMARLLLGQLESAFLAFHEALELIPLNSDPRLRLDILVHLAALKMRQKDYTATRYYLEEAEPLFEGHASRLMWVQRSWLWGLVQLDSGNYREAEKNLRAALAGFRRFNSTLTQAQILVSLGQLYLSTQNDAELDWTVAELAATLRQPEIRLHDLDEVENILREARECGLEIPELSELHNQEEWVH